MKLIMMGTGDFAVPSFRRLLDDRYPVELLVTQPDRPRGRHQACVPASIKQLALDRNVAVFQPEDVNAPDSLEHIARLKPDLLVVAAYGQILSRPLLAVPPLGSINLHASLLPKYRGAAPVNWAIYHGETVTGVTVIRMTPSVDAGTILLQAKTPIEPDETAGALESRLAELGAPLVCQAIDGLVAGTLRGLKQDRALATRAPKLTKQDGQIDWTRSATAVCNQIRAMQPWPMPFTFLRRAAGADPERVLIEQARPQNVPIPSDRPLEPGALIQAEPSALLVQAGDGPVRIERLRPAGKRSMTAEEFLRGHRVQADDRFGSEP